jgi:hypothetical protein
MIRSLLRPIHLLNLPVELICYILDNLEIPDLVQCTLVRYFSFQITAKFPLGLPSSIRSRNTLEKLWATLHVFNFPLNWPSTGWFRCCQPRPPRRSLPASSSSETESEHGGLWSGNRDILSSFHPLVLCMSLLVGYTEMDGKMTVESQHLSPSSNFPRQIHQWTPQISKRGLMQWGTLISSISRWILPRISSSLSPLLHQSTFPPQTSHSPAYLSKKQIKVCLRTTYSFDHNESATPQIPIVRASMPRQTLSIPPTVRSDRSCSCAGGRRSCCLADQRSPGQHWRPSRDMELGTQSAVFGELNCMLHWIRM